MNVREKLVELLLQEDDVCEPSECKYCGVKGSCGYYRTADSLIANNVTVQEWIPVEERLPQEDGSYLVAINGFNNLQSIDIRYFAKDGETVDEYDFAGQKNVWCFYDSEWGYVSTGSVTHWMPLPKLPKGE